MNFPTLNLNYYNVVDNPHFCMFKIQITTITSSSYVKTLGGYQLSYTWSCHLNVLYNDDTGMFLCLLAFFIEVTLLSIASMTFFSSWSIHLPLGHAINFHCFLHYFSVDGARGFIISERLALKCITHIQNVCVILNEPMKNAYPQ